MKVLRMTFGVKEEEAERFSDGLFERGADSVSIDTAERGTTTVRAIFQDISMAGEFLDRAFSVEELEEDIWKNAWLADCHGGELCPDVFVYPVTSSARPEKSYRHVIYIDPRDAFGDGRHPTTVMCARMLCDRLASPECAQSAPVSLLDAGTGTGVLAVLASKLGIPHVDALDIDADAVRMARSNAERNGCKGVSFYHTDIAGFRGKTRYDVVVANLLTEVLQRTMGVLANLVSERGVIIASGIGDRWEREMRQCFRDHNLAVDAMETMDGWCAFMVSRDVVR